ncbi:MAG: tetratricopeptide repeat protein [Gemmatimonadota bacterium]|nr:tetratricopeptide repeat protein [Gemmatimonadota bacterium]
MSRTRPATCSRAPARPWLALLALLGLAAASGAEAVHAQEEADEPRLELTTGSEAAKRHFWAGVHDALNVFAPRAASHFEMALEEDPDLGLAIVMHGFTAPGLTNEEQAARIDEGIAALGSASSNEMLVGLALKEWAAGNGPAASRLFHTASELMPGDPYVASWATQLAGARGDQRDVIARWQALIDAFPDLANPHNSIAYQHFARGNEAAAFEAVRRYVELAPDHPNPADSHAELLQWAGRYPEAYGEYQRAVELAPDYQQGYVGMAEILVLVGAGDGAREALGRALERAPDAGARVTLMRAIANTHMIDGNRDGSMGQLEQASGVAEEAGLDAAQALVHEQMALTDAVTGEGLFIGEYLDEAAALRGSTNPLHHAMAGLAHAAAGDAGMARDASGALDESGSQFWASIARSIDAMVLLAEGDAEAAMDELDKADTENPVVQAVMAEAYDRLERPGAAAALRDRVLGNRQINVANPFWAFAYARVQAD